MSKIPKILIAIADGEHARFVRPRSDHVLYTERQFDSAAAHKQSADLGSDRPGESSHSDAPMHHGLAPRHDLHDLEKAKFSSLVAQQLNEVSGDNAFDALVIAAPSGSLHAIHDGLNTTTRAKLIGTLNKDLSKIPDNALWPHLQQWLRPERPARRE
jgi:protein required for attachment to host cells